jgi:hypothetical protein
MYQEYLFVIGKLKDQFKLDLEVSHREVHTFFKDKRPIFKLLYGTFEKEASPVIVVSFHIDLTHSEAIMWFVDLYKIHPLIRLHDSWIEDSNGETYLGEDADAIKHVFTTQEILSDWLDNHDEEDTREFVNAKVVGRDRQLKPFDSLNQKAQAIQEFVRIKKPDDGESVH